MTPLEVKQSRLALCASFNKTCPRWGKKKRKTVKLRQLFAAISSDHRALQGTPNSSLSLIVLSSPAVPLSPDVRARFVLGNKGSEESRGMRGEGYTLLIEARNMCISSVAGGAGPRRGDLQRPINLEYKAAAQSAQVSVGAHAGAHTGHVSAARPDQINLNTPPSPPPPLVSTVNY